MASKVSCVAHKSACATFKKYMFLGIQKLCFETSYTHVVGSALTLWTISKGSPLVIDELGKPIIIGMFRENIPGENFVSAKQDTPVHLHDKIDADVFQWITEHADGIHDSRCKRFSSCSCGVENTIGKFSTNDHIDDNKNKDKGKRHKRNIASTSQETSEQHPKSNNSSENHLLYNSNESFNKIYDKRDDNDKNNEVSYFGNVREYPDGGHPWTVRILNRVGVNQEHADCRERYASKYCLGGETDSSGKPKRITLGDLKMDLEYTHTHGYSYTQCNGALITHQGGHSH